MPTPPVAPRKPHPVSHHGETWDDPYFWLRQRETDPDVLPYLQAENDYTQQVMADTADLQATLFAEMKGRIKESDQTAPYRRGDYWYYTRTEAGQQYPIHCRKPGSLEAPEEVLLDVNALAVDQPYCRVGVLLVSPDQRWLAYAVDFAGDEMYTLYFKNLHTGALSEESLSPVYYGGGWSADSRHFFYITLDAAKRPYRLHRHTLGTDPAHDTLLHEELDERFYLFCETTHDEAYLVMYLYGFDMHEYHFLPTDQPLAALRVLRPRQSKLEYGGFDHWHGYFYFVCNWQAENFQLMRAPVNDPSAWETVLAHRADTLINGVFAFNTMLVVSERFGGLPRLHLLDPRTGDQHLVRFPEPAYVFGLDPRVAFTAPAVRFTYASLVTPPSVVDYGLADHTWTLIKQDDIPSGYTASDFISERLTATAPDGVAVPISLVYKKGLTGPRPCVLYAYGAYGFNVDPNFNSNRLSLLERGFVFALAHVRGGSEMGRWWYEQGRLLHKRNTFSDFVACADHLIANGYTTAQQLAIWGGSAGGLLVGAVLNLRPNLCAAAMGEVPFVDVISTMSDPTIPLTVPEYDQWGNPADETFYQYMKSYSPYDNVQAIAYPHLLITTGLNDPRVAYWEPAKWAAKLRATTTGSTWLLLKTNMDAGHGGASGRYDFLKDVAFNYAFVLKALSA